MPTRRQFLLATASAWLAQGALTPPGFPDGIDMYSETYENWDGAITTPPLWTCAPRSAADVVEIVNWAHEHGYCVRPRGHRHGWSPLTVAPGETGNVILVDTTRHLTAMSVSGSNVTVQAGASMEALLTHLHGKGLGLAAVPAPGDVTVGGVLAIGGHGTGVAKTAEPGHRFGSLSDLVRSITAVVWNGTRYTERTYRRDDPACAVLLTNLGRAFVTSVTLEAGPDVNLRCRNALDIPATVLFGPTQTARSLSGLIAEHGRVGVIWFAYTDRPWVQTWTVTERKPLLSRRTSGPYNYPFADNLPEAVTDVQSRLMKGQPWLAPLYGQVQLTAVTAGLTATFGWDFWGPSKDVMLFVKPTTARITAASYVVHTPRASLQEVVHRFFVKYSAMLDSYRRRGLFPINGGVEIRVTGVDDGHPVPPALSALRPMPGCDTAVWLDVLTFPDTPGSHEFLAELEEFAHATWPGRYRVEWSKRWGHTAAGAWTDSAVLDRRIPDSIPGWQDHVEALNRLDPHRVFTTALHDRLLR